MIVRYIITAVRMDDILMDASENVTVAEFIESLKLEKTFQKGPTLPSSRRRAAGFST